LKVAIKPFFIADLVNDSRYFGWPQHSQVVFINLNKILMAVQRLKIYASVDLFKLNHQQLLPLESLGQRLHVTDD
jgi:hypothetical protein